jgi:hypothetical protein
MRVPPGRLTPLWAALVTFVVVTAVVGGVLALRDDGGRAGSSPSVAAPRLAVQVVQLRRDEVLGRVELAVTNRGDEGVVVDAIRLTAGGFTGGAWVPKASPVPPGQVVDLPTPYGEPRCPTTGEPRLGPLRADLRVHTPADPTVRQVRVVPAGSRALMTRILRSLCTTRRLRREVALSFGPGWRAEGSGDATRLHTTIEARLAASAPPRDVTQVGGTVIYRLEAAAAGPPYASLDAAHPTASIPVVVSQATCTGHAKGETKQPYRFLVWLGPPGSDGQAVELPVTAAERVRLRAVCAF